MPRRWVCMQQHRDRVITSRIAQCQGPACHWNSSKATAQSIVVRQRVAKRTLRSGEIRVSRKGMFPSSPHRRGSGGRKADFLEKPGSPPLREARPPWKGNPIRRCHCPRVPAPLPRRITCRGLCSGLRPRRPAGERAGSACAAGRIGRRPPRAGGRPRCRRRPRSHVPMSVPVLVRRETDVGIVRADAATVERRGAVALGEAAPRCVDHDDPASGRSDGTV